MILVFHSAAVVHGQVLDVELQIMIRKHGQFVIAIILQIMQY